MKMQKTFFVVLLIALLSTFMMAQSSTAKITGKVVTADGTAIPGVMVTATSSKLVGKAISISDENGIYRLMNLRPGAYKVTYELEGFATMIKPKVTLSMEQTLRISIIMELKKLKETIVVKGEVPLIDVKSASKSMTFSKEIFDALPKGRDFTSLVATIPGVQEEADLSGISVDGASGAENVFYIDGMNTTNLVDGEQGQNASFDFFEEVQVKASGYMAEYGGSLGGVISAITRSGGNEFHGDIVGFYRGNSLRGTQRERLRYDKSDTTKAKYYEYTDLYGDVQDSRFEGGFGIGGYFLKDKVWFFAQMLPKYSKYTNDVNYVDGSPSRTLTTTYNSLNYMLKLSAQILSNVRWTANYLNSTVKRRGSIPYMNDWGPYGSSTADLDAIGFDYPTYSASTSLDISIGNNSMINLRGGFFFQDITNQQAAYETDPFYWFRHDAAGGYRGASNMTMDIPDAYKHGAYWSNYSWGGNTANIKNIAERYSANVDYTLYFNMGGEHSLKMGFEWSRTGEDVDAGAQAPNIFLAWGGVPVIAQQQFAPGTYGYYGVRGNDASGAYGSVYKAYSNRMALYVQDSWTVGEKLTLNFGLRAEQEIMPSYATDPKYADVDAIKFSFGDKIAPRLGFVYDVKGDSSLKVFGSYGLFFDVMKLNIGSSSYGGVKWQTAYYTLDTYEFDTIGVNGNYPGELLYVYNYRPGSFEETDPDMKPMSQQSISFGIESKLTDDISVNLRVVQKHLRYAIEDVGVETPGGSTEYYITNPGYGWSLTEANGGYFSNEYPETPKAKREYWAINLGLEKRFSNNWVGGINYTWSRLTGNYSGLATSDEPGRNSPNVARYFDTWYLSYDKELNPIDGTLKTDRTHVLKAYGSYVFDFGLTIGTTLSVMSGTPISEEWLMDAEGYLPFNRGNLGRTPMRYNVDGYFEYALKLGKTNLSFNLNITNIFNFKIARDIFSTKNYDTLPISDAQFISTDWEYPSDARLDPKYQMEYNYTAPFDARVGVKLTF